MADHPENWPPIQIKPVYSSVSYQQATYQKYNQRGHESPSGYGPLLTVRAGEGGCDVTARDNKSIFTKDILYVFE